MKKEFVIGVKPMSKKDSEELKIRQAKHARMTQPLVEYYRKKKDPSENQKKQLKPHIPIYRPIPKPKERVSNSILEKIKNLIKGGKK